MASVSFNLNSSLTEGNDCDSSLTLVIVLIALVFDFTNGFHDAANSIATVVSTRVLSPRYAVMWAATFNFIASRYLAPGSQKRLAAISSESI